MNFLNKIPNSFRKSLVEKQANEQINKQNYNMKKPKLSMI